MTTAEKLKAIRNRAGLSLRQTATLLGYGERWTTYRINETNTKREFLPIQLAREFEKVFVGKGNPPISSEEVMALAGIYKNELLAQETLSSISSQKESDENLSSMDIELDVTRLKRHLDNAIDGFDATLSQKDYLKNIVNNAPYKVLHSIFWGLISNALKHMPNVQSYLESSLDVDYEAMPRGGCFPTHKAI